MKTFLNFRCLFLITAGSTVFSCQKNHPSDDSQVLESINQANNLLEGINLTYEGIKGEKTFSTENFPWTDTYWPLYQKSTARRWGNIPSDGETRGGSLGISDLVQTGIDLSHSESLSPNLSPAEKYDILYRYRYGKEMNAQLLQTTASWVEEVEKEIDGSEDISLKRTKTSSIYTYLYESPNASEVVSQFPMTLESVKDYLQYNSSSSLKFLNKLEGGSDWGWMGLCHGWAPAAIMAKTPQNHVVVDIDSKKLVVTQGDIRGLLTYSWAKHAPRPEFIGQRCNIDTDNVNSPGPVDAEGRGYSGKMTVAGKETNFYQIREITGLRALNYPRVPTRAMLVRFDDAESTMGILFQMFSSWERFASMEELVQRLITPNSRGEEVNVEIFGCWDTNPASFHAAIVEKIGKEKIGFVMDRTQSGQVWNQPVHKAQTMVGKEISIDNLPTERLRFLTPGTAFVAEVTSQVEWLREPHHPEMAYDASFDQNHNVITKYQYILEFDRRGKVIGGEWGNLKSVRPLFRGSAQQIPDFVFAFHQDQKPEDVSGTGFDYTNIIDKIHACSLQSATTTIEINGISHPAVQCTVQKAEQNP